MPKDSYMRNIATILGLILCFFSFELHAQSEVEELLAKVSKSHDSTKVNIYNQLVFLQLKTDPGQSAIYAARAVDISKNRNYRGKLATSYYNLGLSYFLLGSYPKALDPLIKGFHIYQQQGNKMRMAQSLNLIGGVHMRQKQYQLALENLVQALGIFEEMMLSKYVAKIKINIGEIYLKQGELQMALRYEQEAMKIATRKEMRVDMAFAKGVMGQVYEQQGLLKKSLLFLLSALNEFKAHGDNAAKAEYSINVARIERKMGDLVNAETYAKEGLAWARDMQSKNWILLAYEELAKIYEAQGNYKESVDAYKIYNLFKDSIFNGNNTALLIDLQSNFEAEQHRIELNLHKAQIEKLEQRRNFSILVAIIFIVAFLGLLLSFRNARSKKRLLEVSHRAIEAQNEEIRQQRAAIEEKNKEIEKKNRNIMSSLQYAKRIQRTLMPSEEEVISQFKDAFILLRPRDVVSGDFYWHETIQKENGDRKVIIAAVDSTGHGVPGALMSMIGLEQLTEIVNKEGIYEVDQILNRLHKGIVNILKQQLNKNKDGMDMSLCIIHEKEKVLEFAGAKLGVFYVKDGEGHLLKGDKHPIGGEPRKSGTERCFTKHAIKIEPGMCFYLFSDGFQDQFGGIHKKKFSPRKFRELLLTAHQKPMVEQRAFLEKTLNSWMEQGEEPQIDDILVIGFKCC